MYQPSIPSGQPPSPSLISSYWQLTTGYGQLPLRCWLHLLRCLQDFFDRSLHVEPLLGDVVVLAFHNCLETFHGIRNLHVTSWCAGKLFGDVERLRQEALNLAGTGHGQLLIFAQFIDAENGDD